MVTIRRLYLYSMSAVLLAILAAGVRILLGVLFDTLGLDGNPAVGAGNSREQASLATALIGVSLPVWATHWGLVIRARRGTGLDPARAMEAERRSAIRAAYLAVVLAVSLAFVLAVLQDLARYVAQAVLNLRPPYDSGPDIPGGVATFLVAGVIWASHWRLRRGDAAAGPLDGVVLWHRLYLHGVQFFTLMGACAAFAMLVTVVADRQSRATVAPGDDYLAGEIPAQLAMVVVWGAAFLLHTAYAQRLLASPGWEGASERVSRLRVGYLAVVILIGLTVTLSNLGEAGRTVLLAALGQPLEGGYSESGRGFWRLTLVPLITFVPILVAALYARLRLASEASVSRDPARPVAARRLDLHLRAGVGLAFGAVTIASLLGIALDLVLGGDRYELAGSSRIWAVASLAPGAVLGLVLWGTAWWVATARRARDPEAEADSGIRRAYLMAALGVAIAASVISGAMLLYQLISTVLGVASGPTVLSDIASALGAVVVGLAVAAYHGLLIREDGRVVVERPAAPPVALPAPAEAPATTLLPTERHLTLRAASAVDIDAALAAARAALPPGATLVES